MLCQFDGMTEIYPASIIAFFRPRGLDAYIKALK